MSQHFHLPIYNAAFEFLKELYMRVPKFAKPYKYFLGGRLIEYNVDIIRLIIEANNHRDMSDRVAKLEKLSEKIEILILHCRIADELQQWGNQKGYLFLVEKLVDLSNQAEGWRKASQSFQSVD